MTRASTETLFPAENYDLEKTLDCGQAFRWLRSGDGWRGVVNGEWVELRSVPGGIAARTVLPQRDWRWLADYLQADANIQNIVDSFPRDNVMARAVEHCRGLRLLKQDAWECLASFILSSTKQIPQIKQGIANICTAFGAAVPSPPGAALAWSFPAPAVLAASTERALRECRIGFRAPYLLASARAVASGEVSLEEVNSMTLPEARKHLVRLPGVGPKIADCVLLFAYGFQQAFPVDVWVLRALRMLYFAKKRPKPARIRLFANTYFGPFAGYAQQYLFHYVRTVKGALPERPRK